MYNSGWMTKFKIELFILILTGSFEMRDKHRLKVDSNSFKKPFPGFAAKQPRCIQTSSQVFVPKLFFQKSTTERF
jgi:hypothetical protein